MIGKRALHPPQTNVAPRSRSRGPDPPARRRGGSRAGRSAAARQRFWPFDLAAQPVLLAPEPVELHLAVQCRRVDERVLGGEVDAAPVLAQHAREVVLLRAAQVLLERHLVVVAGMAAVAVPRFLADAAVPGQVELAHVARPGVAHELREGLVRDPVDALLARHLAVAEELADQEWDVLDALAQ